MRGIPLSTSLGCFELVHITNNERSNQGLGFTAAYSGGASGEATIYIYDLGLPEIPDGPKSELVVQNFRESAASFRHIHKDAQLVSSSLVSTATRPSAFLGAEFRVSGGKGPFHTFLMLTAFRGSFFKMRLSLPTTGTTYDAVQEFVNAVAARLWAN